MALLQNSRALQLIAKGTESDVFPATRETG